MLMCNIYFVYFLTVIKPGNGAQLSDSASLLQDLFGNYSKDLRPAEDQSDKLNLSINMYAFSLNDFDEVTGILSMVVAPLMMWTDYRLTWTPSNYGNLTELVIPKTKLWVPEIFIIDPALKMEAFGDDNFVGRIYSNGLVMWVPGGLMKTTCDVNMSDFPFDYQTCSFTISAWGYTFNEVTLQPLSLNTIDFAFYTKNALWDVVGSRAVQEMKGLYSVMKFEINLKRKPLYFVINMLAPIFLLSLLNLLVFILPVESGERISYGITIFLSFAVFMTVLSDNMPKTSEPMALMSYFLILALIMSTLICVLSIITMQFHFKENSPVSHKAVGLLHILELRFLRRLCRKCDNKTKPTGDVVSNILFIKDKDGNKDVWKNSSLQTDKNINSDSAEDINLTWKTFAVALDWVIFWYFSFITVVVWIAFVVILGS